MAQCGFGFKADFLASLNAKEAQLRAELAQAEASAKQSFEYAKQEVLKQKVYNGMFIKPVPNISAGMLNFDIIDPETKKVVHAGVKTLDEAKSLIDKVVADMQKAAMSKAAQERVTAAEAAVATDLKTAESGVVPDSVKAQGTAAAPGQEKKSNLLLYGGIAAGVAALMVLNK